MSQFGRIFVANFLKSKISADINDLYLITTDADFFPLLTHRLILPETKKILVTNPQTSWKDFSKPDQHFQNENIRGKRGIIENWPRKPLRLPIYLAMSCVGATVNSLLKNKKNHVD